MRPTLLVLASTYPRWENDPEPGFVHELCRRLARSFDVVAVVPDAPEAAPSGMLDGVEVLRYRYAPRMLQTLVNNGGIATNLRRSPWKWLLVPGFIGGQYLAARRVIRARRVDAVHAHWLIPQGWIARILLRRHGAPFVVTSHGGDLFGFRGKALQVVKCKVAQASAAMTVVSSAMRDEVVRLDLRPSRLVVLPMGVDLQHRFVVDVDAKRQVQQLLFVGRLVPKKGLPHLLHALPKVLATRPGVTLKIVGFGPEQPALMTLAKQLGIDAQVEFCGAIAQPELPALYRQASAFVAPFVRDESGNQEGLPVVLMEAIGCGCPAIVGNVPGVSELLGDEANAVCVDPRDADALAEAILDVLDHPDVARQRALAIRRAALDKVDWEHIALSYGQIMARVIAERGAGGRS